MGQQIPIDPMPGLAKNNIGIAGNGIITDIKQVGGYPTYAGEPSSDIGNDGRIARNSTAASTPCTRQAPMSELTSRTVDPARKGASLSRSS